VHKRFAFRAETKVESRNGVKHGLGKEGTGPKENSSERRESGRGPRGSEKEGVREIFGKEAHGHFLGRRERRGGKVERGRAIVVFREKPMSRGK